MAHFQLIAFDLDGTLTQHKSKLEPENRALLDALRQKYRLLMVGAGNCLRIFHQMNRYPIDIIGNYGMQEMHYHAPSGQLLPFAEHVLPIDRKSVTQRINRLREAFGFTSYAGDTVEFHDSGVVTFPILGTAAALPEKLAYDPDRTKRRKIYADVQKTFPEFNVFVGGSSSFDMAPKPYCKSEALLQYCKESAIAPEQVAYCGDDYGLGGNDADILQTPVHFIRVDDYRRFGEFAKELF